MKPNDYSKLSFGHSSSFIQERMWFWWIWLLSLLPSNFMFMSHLIFFFLHNKAIWMQGDLLIEESVDIFQGKFSVSLSKQVYLRAKFIMLSSSQSGPQTVIKYIFSRMTLEHLNLQLSHWNQKRTKLWCSNPKDHNVTLESPGNSGVKVKVKCSNVVLMLYHSWE